MSCFKTGTISHPFRKKQLLVLLETTPCELKKRCLLVLRTVHMLMSKTYAAMTDTDGEIVVEA